jgi:hypothetical protein
MSIETLTTSNYSQWIKELENLAKHNEVWQYIDSHNKAKELNLNDYADVQDIDEDDIDILLLNDDDEMTDDELELYCLQMEKRRAKKIASNMKIMHTALKMTAGISAISTCIRDVVKFLAACFDSTLNQQSHNVARFDKSYKKLNLQSQNVVARSIVNLSIVDCSIVDFLNWFQVDWFNDEDWLKTHSKRICSVVSSSVANTASSVADSLDWFERAWFDDTQWLKSSHTVNAVAEMEKPCTVDTVNENSHTVVSAMENACKDVSYSDNSHILGLNSGSEGHTGHGLISSQYTGHGLILGGGQNRTSYIIKEMMEKFLNMGSSTEASNSVDLGQCNKISRGLGGLDQDQVTISRELDQDQVIQITNEMKFHLKIHSPANQRGVTDGFCRRAKYGHFRSGKDGYFRSDKDGHFGPAKDEHFRPDKDGVFGLGKDFYMSGKWIFRAWCGSAFFKAEGVCQAISGRLVGVG